MQRQTPEEPRHPWWKRLLMSLRPDVDLKDKRFWIKGKVDF